MLHINKLLKSSISSLLLIAVISGCASTTEPAKPNNPVTVQAMDFSQTNKAKIEKQQKSVGYIKNGTYLTFDQINLDQAKNTVVVEAATTTQGGTVEIRLGGVQGELVGTLKVNKTGKWYNWKTFSGNLNKPIKGTQKITLVFTGGNNWLFNIKSVTFKNMPTN